MPDARWTMLATLVAATLPGPGCGVQPTADVGGVTLPVAETGDPTTEAGSSGVLETTAAPESSADSSPPPPGDSSSSSDTGMTPLLDVGSDETGTVMESCEGAPDLVHVLAGNQGEIWSFDPEAISFSPVTTLACPELSNAVSIDSFSIDRNADVWVLSRHPEDPMVGPAWPMQITRFDPASSSCEIVWYGALPESTDCGDVAFVSALDDPAHERLFVHACTGGGFLLDAWSAPRLFRFDPVDAMPAPIALGQDTFSTAPIAGTGDGRLYGVAGNGDDPSSTIIVQFDQDSGAVVDTLPAPDLDLGFNAGQLALAFYGGDLLAFGIDHAEGTDELELLINRYDLDDDDGNGEHDTELLAPALPLPFLSWTLIAAASPTCIPTGPAG